LNLTRNNDVGTDLPRLVYMHTYLYNCSNSAFEHGESEVLFGCVGTASIINQIY